MKLRNRQITGRTKRRSKPSRRLLESQMKGEIFNSKRKRQSKKTEKNKATFTTTTTTTTTTDPPKGTILRVINDHFADITGELEAKEGDLIEVLGPSEFSGRIRARLCKNKRKRGIIQIKSFLSYDLDEPSAAAEHNNTGNVTLSGNTTE